jgi:hypothetical protein
MGRKHDENQTIFAFAFKARKPKRGWYFVCMRRRKVYGQVCTVRPDKSFKRTGPYGVVIDSRKSGSTWESVQYDESGEFRFMEKVPIGFSGHLACRS